jgi:hypothetical protein
MKDWINFGNLELLISDKANVSNCFANMKQENYQCRAYEKGTKNAYLKFTGSESSTFKVSEWEAWRVEMIEKLETKFQDENNEAEDLRGLFD